VVAGEAEDCVQDSSRHLQGSTHRNAWTREVGGSCPPPKKKITIEGAEYAFCPPPQKKLSCLSGLTS